MRIESLTLENFRCFRGSATSIDLSADVIAVYGRNGAGKTTIFDAIEFGLLGDIGRFPSDASPAAYIPNVMERGTARVRIALSEPADSHVEVALDPHAELQVGGSGNWSNHRDFLYACLISQQYQPARREVAVVRELFRSSILLSQFSIRDFVEAGAEKRARVLTNIAGQAFLQRCIEKAQEVETLAGRRIDLEQTELGGLRESLERYDGELREAEVSRKTLLDGVGATLVSRDALIDSIATAGLPIKAQALQELDPDSVMEVVTAACKESAAELRRRTSLLAELEALMPGHNDRIRDREELAARRDETRRNLAHSNVREQQLTTMIAEVTQRIGGIQVPLDQQLARASVLDELAGLQTRFSESQSRLVKASTRERELRHSLAQEEVMAQAASQEQQNLEAETVRLRQSVEVASHTLERLEVLTAWLPHFSIESGQARQYEQQIASLTDEIRDTSARSEEMRRRLAELQAQLHQLQRQQAPRSSWLEGKNDLVARLRQYATDRECPLCGHRHESPEALIQAIESQLRDVPQDLHELAQRAEEARQRMRHVDGELRSLQQRLAQCEKERTLAAETRLKAVVSIEERMREAEMLGTALDAESLEATRLRVQEELDVAQRGLAQTERQLRDVAQRQEQTAQRAQRYSEALADSEREAMSEREASQRLEQVIRDRELTDEIELPAQALAEERRHCHGEIDRLQKAKAEQEAMLNNAQNELESLRRSRPGIEDNLREYEERMARTIEAIERFEAACRNTELPYDVTIDSVNTMRRDLRVRIDNATVAQQTAERYRRSSHVNRLDERADAIGKERSLLQGRRQKSQQRLETLKYAAGQAVAWRQTLEEQAVNLVETRIRAHQPQIRRLFRSMIPCPHSFRDFLMERREDGLHFGLLYRDQVREAGEPRLFLSNAQANVLALAIFLSLSCSQNWSNLDTMLLDDPVQHLDDLDAVAFLDNLREASLGRFGRKRQLIISTCDQNLYLLMIRKFRLLEAEGLRFRGISLLENGTGTPDVVYDVGGPDASGLASAG